MKKRRIIYVQDVPLCYFEYCLKKAQEAGDKKAVRELTKILKQFKPSETRTMSDKRYSIDELACALEAHFRRPGNDLSRFQVDAIIARLRKADELCEVAKEVVETTSQGPRLRSFGALSLSKAISDYEEGR